MNNEQTTKASALNITLSKEVLKNIKKLNYYSEDQFINDCYAYIKAIKEQRMLCIIKSVSSSGMSRIIKFSSCEKGQNNFWYCNYNCLFIALGYTEAKKDGFRINGCGMDMIFHTNYSICHQLKNMDIISKEDCEKYCQLTPVVL
jgi:hypothetical protein